MFLLQCRFNACCLFVNMFCVNIAQNYFWGIVSQINKYKVQEELGGWPTGELVAKTSIHNYGVRPPSSGQHFYRFCIYSVVGLVPKFRGPHPPHKVKTLLKNSQQYLLFWGVWDFPSHLHNQLVSHLKVFKDCQHDRPVFSSPDLYAFDSTALGPTHIIHQIVPNHQHLNVG